jgi:hypothetical protein
MRVWNGSPRDEWVPVPETIDRAVVSALRDEALADGWHVQAAWRILTVHHLTGEKADCRWWNLAALCQRCHLFIQRKVVMERPWPWAHDEWFKPHAAGWYAHHHLGLDLAREETMDQLDWLLALGAREAAFERMAL